MSHQTLRSAVLGRLRCNHEDDRGSLPLLMMVIIASAALGAIMLSTVISQTRTSHFVQSRVGALQAAQSGIDFALSQLRAATSDNVTVGTDARLPCGSTDGVNPKWTSQSANNDSTSTYTVSIAYYSVDPSTLGTDDLAKWANGKEMKCTSAGPYNTVSHIRTPRYALITSTGVNGSGAYTSTGRTLQTTYNFQILDQNIAGGVIRLYPASSTQANQWCMDAGSNPAVGVAVTLQACSTSNPPASRQVWQYRSDLSIELVSSVTNPKLAGLCLDTGASPTAHAAGDPILLEQCGVADSSVCPAGYTPTTYHSANPNATCSISPWNQQWSTDDYANLEGALTDQSDIDHFCINAASQAAGTALNLAQCGSQSTTDPQKTWIPAPTAGGGMSGAGNQQLVNFQQFASCLDVTGAAVGATFLILYSCKQNPNPAKVAFNQKFIPSPALSTTPTQVLITVVKGSTTYCLQSPQTVGGYPVLVQQGSATGQCPANVSAAGAGSSFVWTMSQRYSDSAGTIQLPYANRYTIKDSSATPLCLGIGANTDLYNVYSKAVVTTCNGSTGQKWNAVASLAAATLTNTAETPANVAAGG